jgi:hypothetical protein
MVMGGPLGLVRGLVARVVLFLGRLVLDARAKVLDIPTEALGGAAADDKYRYSGEGDACRDKKADCSFHGRFLSGTQQANHAAWLQILRGSVMNVSSTLVWKSVHILRTDG